MFRLIESWLEKKLNYHIENKCEDLLKQELEHFKKLHPLEARELEELQNKIVTEINRIYPMAEESVLKERIIRARYTFLSGAIIGPLLVGILTNFHGSLLAYSMPVISASAYWGVSIALIPLAFEKRIMGGLKSISRNFERTLREREQKPLAHILTIRPALSAREQEREIISPTIRVCGSLEAKVASYLGNIRMFNRMDSGSPIKEIEEDIVTIIDKEQKFTVRI